MNRYPVILLAASIILPVLLLLLGSSREEPIADSGVPAVLERETSATATANPVPSVPELNAELTTKIRRAIDDGGDVTGAIQIVDAERRIACGTRSSASIAAVRRFVWIGVTETLVTDDGGSDFAILVQVCDPDRLVQP